MATIRSRYNASETIFRLDGMDSLKGANLMHANLGCADLRGADLRAADLGNADLRYADLGNADLRYANLGHATLGNADLSGTNLCGANLICADINHADLRNANLSDADLWGANLWFANLRGSCLRNTYIRHANLINADFGESNLEKTNIRDVNFAGANLGSAKLPPHIPILDRPYTRILEQISGGGGLDMKEWHACETTHCLAGWLVHLCGAKGCALEAKWETLAAGALIHARNCPNALAPDFYSSNEVAMDYIIERAKEESAKSTD